LLYMYADFFNKFRLSRDTLWVYEGDQLIFTSAKDRLLPLLEYIGQLTNHHPQNVIFDKIVGNAAALLSIKAGCREVYSLMASQLAIRTLDRYGIKYYFTETVPCIQKPGGDDMCPMEKLSIGKEPQEFYELMLEMTANPHPEAASK
jgi:hypothetical protein